MPGLARVFFEKGYPNLQKLNPPRLYIDMPRLLFGGFTFHSFSHSLIFLIPYQTLSNTQTLTLSNHINHHLKTSNHPRIFIILHFSTQLFTTSLKPHFSLSPHQFSSPQILLIFSQNYHFHPFPFTNSSQNLIQPPSSSLYSPRRPKRSEDLLGHVV